MPIRTVPPLTGYDLYQAKEVIWDMLHIVREDHLASEDGINNDAHWDEVCTAMAWLQEAAGCEEIMDGEEIQD